MFDIVEQKAYFRIWHPNNGLCPSDRRQYVYFSLPLPLTYPISWICVPSIRCIYFSVHYAHGLVVHRIRVIVLYGLKRFTPRSWRRRRREGKSIFLLSEATLVTLLEQETRVYDYLKGNRYLLRHKPKVQGLMILVAQPLCPRAFPSQIFHEQIVEREFSFLFFLLIFV